MLPMEERKTTIVLGTNLMSKSKVSDMRNITKYTNRPLIIPPPIILVYPKLIEFLKLPFSIRVPFTLSFKYR